MVAKSYILTWIVFAVSVLIAYATESLSLTKLAIVGFMGSTLFFLGLVALLPYLMDKHYASGRIEAGIKKTPALT